MSNLVVWAIYIIGYLVCIWIIYPTLEKSMDYGPDGENSRIITVSMIFSALFSLLWPCVIPGYFIHKFIKATRNNVL